MNHNYTYVSSFLNLPWLSTPSHRSRLSQSTRLSSLCSISSFPLATSLHMTVYICQCYPLNSFHPFLPPLCPKSVLYVCISIPALQIGSSVPLFYILYICVNIRNLFFSFWLTSLCVTGSGFIHLTGTDSYHFYGWVIFHCRYVLQLLIGKTLFDISHSNIFFDSPPRVMEIKTKIYKWDLIKLRAFAQQRKP